MDLKGDENSPNQVTACELLDKIALNQLHLMEDKLSHEIVIESKILEGSIHLAKTRYIMGQTSVSTAQLPTESSQEFTASVHTEAATDNQFNVVENKTENVVNPLRWFGILVPQNMHRAQEIFKSTVKHVADCANVQYQLYENMRNMDMLKKYKQHLKSV